MKSFPFPYFGAGEAQYFESVGVWVRFRKKPTGKIRKPLDQFWIDGRDLYVAGEPRKGVNEAIEKWLIETHARSPIEFAFRAEDLEAGGTRFSDWHRWSLRQKVRLSPPKGLAIVAHDQLLQMLGERPDWGKAAMSGDAKALAKLRVQARTDKCLAESCARAAETWMHSKTLAARRLFDVAIENPKLGPRVYCNALFTLQRVGREDPKKQRDLYARFIARCLPHARKNPAIHVNVAGVHMLLGDRDAALDALEAAKRLRAPELVQAKAARDFAPLRRDPRFIRLFA